MFFLIQLVPPLTFDVHFSGIVEVMSGAAELRKFLDGTVVSSVGEEIVVERKVRPWLQHPRCASAGMGTDRWVDVL